MWQRIVCVVFGSFSLIACVRLLCLLSSKQSSIALSLKFLLTVTICYLFRFGALITKFVHIFTDQSDLETFCLILETWGSAFESFVLNASFIFFMELLLVSPPAVEGTPGVPRERKSCFRFNFPMILMLLISVSAGGFAFVRDSHVSEKDECILSEPFYSVSSVLIVLYTFFQIIFILLVLCKKKDRLYWQLKDNTLNRAFNFPDRDVSFFSLLYQFTFVFIISWDWIPLDSALPKEIPQSLYGFWLYIILKDAASGESSRSRIPSWYNGIVGSFDIDGNHKVQYMQSVDYIDGAGNIPSSFLQSTLITEGSKRRRENSEYEPMSHYSPEMLGTEDDGFESTPYGPPDVSKGTPSSHMPLIHEI